MSEMILKTLKVTFGNGAILEAIYYDINGKHTFLIATPWTWTTSVSVH